MSWLAWMLVRIRCVITTLNTPDLQPQGPGLERAMHMLLAKKSVELGMERLMPVL